MNINLIKKMLVGSLLIVFLLLASGVVALLLSSMDTRKYWVEQMVSRSLHRDFRIDGDFQLRLGSAIELIAEKVSLQNARWGSPPEILTVGRLELQLQARSLLAGKLDYRILLEAPQLTLETSVAGEQNWIFTEPAISSDIDSDAPEWLRWLPASVHASSAKISIYDTRTDKQDLILFERFKLGIIDGQWQFDVAGNFNDLPMQIESQLSAASGSGSGNYTIEIAGQLGALEGTASGRWIENGGSENPGIDLRWDIDSPTLQFLDIKALQSLPDIGPFQASGRLYQAGDALAISELAVHVRDPALTLSVEGTIGNLLLGENISLQLIGSTDRLAALLEIFSVQTEYVLPGNLQFGGQLSGNFVALTLERIEGELRAKTDKLEFSGKVDNLRSLQGLDIKLNGIFNDPQRWLNMADIKMNNNDPISVSMQMAKATEKSGPISVNAKFSTASVMAELIGDLDNLSDIDRLAFDVDIQADLLADLGDLWGAELAGVGPVAITARLARSGHDIDLRDIRGRIDESDFQGNLKLELTGKNASAVRKLSGKLQSRVFDLGKLRDFNVQIAIEQGGVAADESLNVDAENRLFSTEKLPFEWLQQQYVNVELEIEQLKESMITLENLSTIFYLEKGHLELRPFTADINGKPVDMDLSLDASTRPATYALRVAVEEFQLDTLLVDDSRTVDALGSINANLKGRGDSIAGIMGGLNGQVGLIVKNVYFSPGILGALSKSVLDQLNPIKGDRSISVIECAAAYLDIKDGIATTPRGLAVQLSNVTWLGKGDINLKTEKINIALKSKARKGLGVSFNQLTDLVLIAGTLMHPRMQLDPEGVVGATANYAAALSTGGISLVLVGLWKKYQANSPVCDHVMGVEDKSTQPQKKSFSLFSRDNTASDEDDEND